MRSSHRRAAALAVIAMLAALVSGCGGGNPGPAPSTKWILTGEVHSSDVSDARVVGAVVTIGGKSATTDANGSYRLEYDTAPAASTWSVDGTHATPGPGYADSWAKLGIVTQVFDPKALPMPAITSKTMAMPTVYLWSLSSPPP